MQQVNNSSTSKVYNLAGELISSTDRSGKTTEYLSEIVPINGEDFVSRKTSFPYDDVANRVWAQESLSYLDGSSYQTTGPAVTGVRTLYEINEVDKLYEINANGDLIEINPDRSRISGSEILKDDGSLSGEKTIIVTSFSGQNSIRFQSDAQGVLVKVSESQYNDLNQLEWTEDALGRKTYYDYDPVYGNQTKSYLIDPDDGPVQTTEIEYGTSDLGLMGNVRRTTTTSGVAPKEDVVIHEKQLVGNNVASQAQGVVTSIVSDVVPAVAAKGATNESEAIPYQAAKKTVIQTSEYGNGVFISENKSIYKDGQLETQTQYDANGLVMSETSYTYTNFGQVETVTQAGLVTHYSYHPDGQLHKVTTPYQDPTTAPPEYDPQVTTYVYSPVSDGSRIVTTTLPDGGEQTTEYNAKGQLVSSYGDRTYKMEYSYDYAGRTESLKTWQDAINGDPSITWWTYNLRGEMIGKYYAYDPANPPDLTYTYDNAGQLLTRTGGRGIVTTYTYDSTYGYLMSISYDDEGTTPSVSYSDFDQQGRYETITDASGTRTVTYESGGVMSEQYAAPWSGLDTLKVKRGVDPITGQYNAMGLENLPGGITYDLAYGYDDATRRFESVTYSDGASTHTSTYGYKDETSLLESLTQHNGIADLLVSTRSHDDLYRLETLAYNQPYDMHNVTYTYNAANQRVSATYGNAEAWDYAYDTLGQVTAGTKTLADDTTIPGYDFGYSYDDIGNRKTAERDQNPARKKIYYNAGNAGGEQGANALNQYGSIELPRVLGVLGKVDLNAAITLNGNAVTRSGDYFQGLIDFSNDAQADDAHYVPYLLRATLAGAGDNGTDAVAEMSGYSYLSPNPVNMTYDLDGNLTADGRWIYTWNGENRLIEMETHPLAVAAGAPKQKLTFAYDGQGRRFRKMVFSWDTATAAYVESQDAYYIYDGWNLLAELRKDATQSYKVHQAYVWGLDLSGSMQGAGGVGGLLAINHRQADDTFETHYPLYDGNGNIMTTLSASTGDKTASYGYGPFGETLRATGNFADANPFQFSTKYQDKESGYLYYGFRYYDPETGRWPNRDPIAEQGGYNLYGFVGNGPTNGYDFLGMLDWKNTKDIWVIQTILNNNAVDLGINLGESGSGKNGIDGDYGPKTKAAVCVMQNKLRKLGHLSFTGKPDGKWGTKTDTAYNAAVVNGEINSKYAHIRVGLFVGVDIKGTIGKIGGGFSGDVGIHGALVKGEVSLKGGAITSKYDATGAGADANAEATLVLAWNVFNADDWRGLSGTTKDWGGSIGPIKTKYKNALKGTKLTWDTVKFLLDNKENIEAFIQIIELNVGDDLWKGKADSSALSVPIGVGLGGWETVETSKYKTFEFGVGK